MSTAMWITIGVLGGVLLTIAASMIRDSWRNAGEVIEAFGREIDEMRREREQA